MVGQRSFTEQQHFWTWKAWPSQIHGVFDYEGVADANRCPALELNATYRAQRAPQTEKSPTYFGKKNNQVFKFDWERHF